MRKVHLMTDRQAACGKRFVECTTNAREVTCLACIEAQEAKAEAFP
jgi:hypothetical protein